MRVSRPFRADATLQAFPGVRFARPGLLGFRPSGAGSLPRASRSLRYLRNFLPFIQRRVLARSVVMLVRTLV
jgi:hypothetical protein